MSPDHYYERCVDIQLRAEADVNLCDRYGSTALMYASKLGYQKIVRSLIGTGADVNIVNRFSYTVLVLAADRGHYRCMDLLVRAGADVNFKPTNIQGARSEPVCFINGQAALFAALTGKWSNWRRCVRANNHRCVMLLLNAGADVNARNTDGLTALTGYETCQIVDKLSTFCKRETKYCLY